MLQSTIDQLADNIVVLGRGSRRGCGLAIGDGRVLAPARRLRGEHVELRGADGRRATAEVIGIDRRAGLALLRADLGETPAVRWAEQAPVATDAVHALGDPGTGLRVTSGEVSAPAISVRGRDGRTVAMIEHTAPLPHRAGGGPLVDAEGVVLGVNLLRGDPGFLLALPAVEVLSAVARAEGGRRPLHLGIAVASPHSAQRLRAAVGLEPRDGVLVRAVEDGSTADRAGVRAGDLLVRLGTTELADLDALFAALDAHAGSAAIPLALVRGADELELVLEPGGAES